MVLYKVYFIEGEKKVLLGCLPERRTEPRSSDIENGIIDAKDYFKKFTEKALYAEAYEVTGVGR